MPEVVGGDVRIPIERSSIVLYLREFGFAVVGVVVLYWAIETLEIIFTAYGDACFVIWEGYEVDIGIDTCRRLAFLSVLMEMFKWSRTARSIADNIDAIECWQILYEHDPVPEVVLVPVDTEMM